MGGERFYPIPSNQTNIKHISRLESVQVAIEDSLTKLEQNSPDKRVGLVSFNQDVNVYGDGKMEFARINGQDLENKSRLKFHAESTPDFDSIVNRKSYLRDKILSLEEGGATALGPALYYSVLVASRKRGSQVILCTDGLANKGLGSLDNLQNRLMDSLDAVQFYNEIASIATENG